MKKFQIIFNLDHNSSSKNKETLNEKSDIIIKIKERKVIYLEDKDITAIEIIDTDEFKNKVKFLYCDLNFIEGYKQYTNQDVFILQHPNSDSAHVAVGKIIEIDENKEYEFKHTASTDRGSSGSPIILYYNERVVGVHKAAIKSNNENANLGTFIGEIINEVKNLIEEEEKKKEKIDILDYENEEVDLNEPNLFRYNINGVEKGTKYDSIVVKHNDVIAFSNWTNY